MKHILQLLFFVFFLSIALTPPAFADPFDYNNLMLVVYQDGDNELGIDLGLPATLAAQPPGTVLFPAGTINPTGPHFGPTVRGWDDLHAACFTIHESGYDPVTWVPLYTGYFASKYGTAVPVNTAPAGNFYIGNGQIHRGMENGAVDANIGVMPSDSLLSYGNKLSYNGQMGGYNLHNADVANFDLAVVETTGYVDMYLFKYGEDGNVVKGSGTDYMGIIRLNSDGSIVWNPSGGNEPPNVTVSSSVAPVDGTITINEGDTLIITTEAEDPDGDNMSWDVDSVGDAPNSPIKEGPTQSGNKTVWTYTWTPGADEGGDHIYTLKFTVSDEGDLGSSETLKIKVNNVNTAPVVTADTATVIVSEGETVTFDLEATDADAEALILTDVVIPEGAGFTDLSGSPGGTYTSTFSWTTDFSDAGSHTIQFSVTDGTAQVSRSKTIQVNNVNQMPVLNEITNETISDPTVQFSKVITATDEDNVELTLQYQVEGMANLPGQITIDGPVQDGNTQSWTFRWTPGTGTDGRYTVDFTVVETTGDTTLTSDAQRAVFTIGSGTNQPPEFSSIAPIVTVEGASLVLDLTVNNEPEQTLSYSVEYPQDMAAGHGASLDTATGSFSWIPPAGFGTENGKTYSLQFTVTEDTEEALTDEVTVPITVHANQLTGTPGLNTPADGGEVTTTQGVVLSVNNASDSDKTEYGAYGQTLTYTFQIYSDQGMAPQSLIAEETIPEGIVNDTTEWTIPAALTEDAVYYWQCFVFDGIENSQPAAGSFMVNATVSAPTIPVLILPDDGAQISDGPALRVQNSTDDDGDEITYDFQVLNLSDTVVYEKEGVLEGNDPPGENTPAGYTSWKVEAGELSDNTTYKWRARAKDSGENYSAWSDTFEFMLDTSNEAPTAPVFYIPPGLSFPYDANANIYGGEMDTDQVILIVANATDADVDDTLTYLFEIVDMGGDVCGNYSGPDGESALIPEGQIEAVNPEGGWGGGVIQRSETHTAWRPPVLNDNTHYCWRVRAIDSSGLEGPVAETSFFVNLSNDLPTACTILSPKNNTMVGERMPVLKVGAATDIDGDRISYDFILWNDSGDEYRSGELHEKTEWQAPVSLVDGVWYWKVETFDEHATEYTEHRVSEEVRFTVDINDLPGKPTIYSPRNNGTVSSLQPTLMVKNAVDPDADDLLSYEFELYSDASFANYTLVGTEIIPETEDFTSWTVPVPLRDGMTYHWRVRTLDAELDSGWTSTMKFHVDTSGEMIVNVEAGKQLSPEAAFEQAVEVKIEDSPIYGVRVLVPAGAITESLELTIGYVQNPPASNGFKVMGKVLEFGPAGTVFAVPVTIQVPYRQADLDAAGVSSPELLKLYNYNEDDNQWEEVEIESIDTENRRISCRIDHFSFYFIGAPGDDTDTPAAADTGSGGGGGSCFIGTIDDARLKAVDFNWRQLFVYMIPFLAVCLSGLISRGFEKPQKS